MKYLLCVSTSILFSCCLLAQTAKDTIQSKKKNAAAHWRMTARLHSKGIFNYGGRVGSDNPTFDVNFVYDRKKWGLLVFKGLDLIDHYTHYNFALISVYKNFKVSKAITFTPYVGSFLEEAKGFADRGSDAVFIHITTVRLNPHITFEHMGLFANLILEPEMRDWVNRFRFTYNGKHIDVLASYWHNNEVFDISNYSTAALNVAYSRVKVSEHLFLSAGVTGLVTLYTSDITQNPARDALMFTLAASWVN